MSILYVSACSTVNEDVKRSTNMPSSDPKEIAKQALPKSCLPNICNVPPKLIFAVPPGYPSSAKRAGEGGFAKVVFDIESSGEVSNVRLLEASSPVFASVVFEAVKQWKYIPAVLDGENVKIKDVEQPFRFETGKRR